jgi:hypothetical protein
VVPLHLYTHKKPLAPTGEECRWASDSLWEQCRREKLLSLSGIEPTYTRRPVQGQVTVLTVMQTNIRKIKQRLIILNVLFLSLQSTQFYNST